MTLTEILKVFSLLPTVDNLLPKNALITNTNLTNVQFRCFCDRIVCIVRIVHFTKETQCLLVICDESSGKSLLSFQSPVQNRAFLRKMWISPYKKCKTHTKFADCDFFNLRIFFTFILGAEPWKYPQLWWYHH